MEQRIGNIIIQAPGGTAGRSSHTFKIALPSVWMQEMGITEEDRQVELSFDGKEIRIVKCLSIDGFLCQGHESGDKYRTFLFIELYTKVALSIIKKAVSLVHWRLLILSELNYEYERPTRNTDIDTILF